MTNITQEQIESVLSDLAAKDPNYVYPSPERGTCYYTHPDGSPGCIFGHALDELGIARPLWGSDANHEGIVTLLEVLGLKADEKTMLFMEEVQCQQDKGTPWGTAVARGKALYGD